jgi:hypothetical protein
MSEADGAGGERGTPVYAESPGRHTLRSGAARAEGGPEAPCLRCGVPLPVRRMGCKGGHCPNCGHPYPHGDCSD